MAVAQLCCCARTLGGTELGLMAAANWAMFGTGHTRSDPAANSGLGKLNWKRSTLLLEHATNYGASIELGRT